MFPKLRVGTVEVLFLLVSELSGRTGVSVEVVAVEEAEEDDEAEEEEEEEVGIGI
jgi:hypothetical protein